MMTRIFLTVFLSAALGLSALAQNSTNAGAQSSSANMTTSDREPLQEPKAQGFWDGDDPNIVNLVLHPFASKKYVLRHTQPIKDRLNELDELTAENSRNIKDVDSRAQQGVQMASEKVSLADQHASDASMKAQTAQTAANQASTRVASAEQMVSSLDQYKGGEQTEIRFRSGQTVLSKTAKNALDQMAEPLKSQKSYIIEVRGFAPGRGQAAVASSKKMTDSVVRYLVLTQNIPVYRIYTMNLGNVQTGEAAAHRVTSGRVEVNVLQNGAVTAQK